MTDKENKWIKFYPSLELPKERVSIAYDTHDERGVRYAYGYFQFYNGTCGCFWKEGNEQPKVVKAEDIKYWMPVPSLDVQKEPVRIKKGCKYRCLSDMQNTDTGAFSFFKDKIYFAPKDNTLVSEENGWLCDISENSSNFELIEEPVSEKKCMFTNDNYTDEERKALCDGCKEECKFNKKEVSASEEQVKELAGNQHVNETCKENGDSLTQESVSEDLEKAASRYAKEEYSRKNPATLPDRCIGCYAPIMYAFKAGANWQKQQILDSNTTLQMTFELGKQEMKQQMMANAVDATVHIDAGGYPYIQQMELYDYDKDIPLAKEGDKYKVILIKE